MALTLDGSTFAGMDDDIAGDGTSGDTWPVDTYLENAVAANTSYLWKSGWSCGWAPNIANGRERLTSWQWSTILILDLPADPLPDGITFHWLAEITNRQATSHGPEMQLRGRVRSGAQTLAEDIFEYTDTTGDLEPNQLTLPLGGVQAPNDLEYVRLELAVRQSRENLVFDDLPQITGGVTVTQDPDADILQLANDFTVTDDAAARLYFSGGGGNFVAENEVNIFDIVDFEPTADDMAVAWPSSIPRPTSTINRADISVMDHIKIEGLEVTAEYPDEPSGQYADKDQSTMLAQQAVRGSAVASHPQRTNAEYFRQRPCAIAPPTDTDQFSGSLAWWRHIFASETSGSFTELCSLPIEFGVSQGRFLARLRWYASTHYQKVDVYDPSQWIDVYLGADWQFRLTVQQLKDGDTSWADATDIAGPATINAKDDGGGQIKHYLRSTRGGVPWLFQVWTAEEFAGGNFNETFREGRAFESDLKYLTQNVYSEGLDLNANADPFAPARLKLEVSGPTTGDEFDLTAVEKSDASLSFFKPEDGNESHLLSLAGLSLYEQGL